MYNCNKWKFKMIITLDETIYLSLIKEFADFQLQISIIQDDP